MALDLEEQEQIDELKSWWNSYGKLVVSLVAIAAIAFGGFKFWNHSKQQTATEASTLYQQLLVSEVTDLEALATKAKQLTTDYASTPYAARGALYLAKLQYQAKQAEKAKPQLEWAMNNARETSISAMARYELAALLVEEKKYDEAIKTLDATLSAGFDGLYWDLKGDILLEQGKSKEAKAAYERALTKLNPAGKYRLITQQKLAALG